MGVCKNVFILTLVCILAACANKPFTYLHGHTDANFAELKTYRWAPDNRTRAFPEVARTFVSTIDKELAKKGFTMSKDGPVDFIMAFDITAKSRVDVDKYSTYGGTGIGFVWRRNTGLKKDPVQFTGVSADSKLVGKGTVILDAIDPNTNKVFWRAVANKDFEIDGRIESQEPLIDVNKTQKNMAIAAKNMVSQFPPEESGR